MRTRAIEHPLRQIGRRVATFLGAVLLSGIFFMVLPLMQTIAQGPKNDLLLQSVDTAQLAPPPEAPLEEETPPEPETQEQPPELAEDATPLDLSQLELALNPGFSDSWAGAGDFAVKINSLVTTAASGDNDMDAIFSMADLEQPPRATYQANPVKSRELAKRTPATVYLIFIVDERGRVVDPKVQKSTDPLFEAPALAAIKQWRFEPGKRGGQAVRTRVRQPITFPKD